MEIRCGQVALGFIVQAFVSTMLAFAGIYSMVRIPSSPLRTG
jgi:hypothetical protein